MTGTLLAGFDSYVLVFCRVGLCLMVMPGIGSARVSASIRLFLALAVSAAVAPVVEPASSGNSAKSVPVAAGTIAAECGTGFLLGLLVRILFASVQMAGSIMSQAAGFSNPAATDVATGDPAGELGIVVSTAVVTLMFALDLQTDVIKALIESYEPVPLGGLVEPERALQRLDAAVVDAFRAGVAVAGPVAVVSVVINFALGIINKVAPQVPVIFISAPFLAATAIWLLFELGPSIALSTARRIIDLVVNL